MYVVVLKRKFLLKIMIMLPNKVKDLVVAISSILHNNDDDNKYVCVCVCVLFYLNFIGSFTVQIATAILCICVLPFMPCDNVIDVVAVVGLVVLY